MSCTVIAKSLKGCHHPVNQDHQKVLQTEDGRAAILQADGHGGRYYTRSKLGARIACRAAEEAFFYDFPLELWPEFIKDTYDRMVAKHLAMRPLSSEELQILDGRPAITAYGCTFHGAVLKKNCCGTVQLGDGEVHLLSAQGRFLPLPEKDPDCLGNLTSSLCYSRMRALQHFRTAVYPEPASCAIAFTDGYQHQTDRPVHAALLLNAFRQNQLTEDLIFDLLKAGEHGDDETFAMIFFPELTESKAFLQGLDTEVLAARTQIRCGCLEQEISELTSYLNMAKIKLQSLKKRGKFFEYHSFSRKTNDKLTQYKEALQELDQLQVLLHRLQNTTS